MSIRYSQIKFVHLGYPSLCQSFLKVLRHVLGGVETIREDFYMLKILYYDLKGKMSLLVPPFESGLMFLSGDGDASEEKILAWG